MEGFGFRNWRFEFVSDFDIRISDLELSKTRSAAGRQEAPLIPKLRGYVAEFLHERSLERLRIFISPTCVGFSTDNRFVRRRLFLSVIRGASGS